ncbi:hypothetical protein, conserved [Leishmania tarentolae]|uniref:Guanine nucleotide-binding protein subunit beta-like protein n=1 Tax=Leishmania tarentolae TaxID=5689 RepID=A0A640KTV7_LEITA|nr:hypothetical protein, conserved [Leishmania tarentolae]
MPSSHSGTLATSPLQPESPHEDLTPDTPPSAPFRLEEAPVYRDDWARQHPFIHLLFHRDTITHLVWCAAACRYLTGGADGAVKLWRSELQPRISLSDANSFSSVERPVLIPDVHVATLGGPVTDLRTSTRDVGNSEVVVIASTDGTLTLCRTSTGETIRTLRGARGESLEPCGAVAEPRSKLTRLGTGKKDAVGDSGNGTLGEGGREITHRSSTAPTWYVADAYSFFPEPSSNMAVVRRPVYTVRAYRNEAREARASHSNEYFQGLRAVAPTYEHLAPHETMIADVLMHFSIAPTHKASAHTSTMSRQWYACAIALAAAPPIVFTGNIGECGAGASSSSSHSTLDPLLLLGFPQGLVQVYVLPQRWFSLHQHGETRLDPPAVRVPVFSGLLHSAAVLRIEVIVSRDVVVSVSEDGTTQLRRLSCLRAPLRQLNVVVSLPTPLSRALPSTLISVPLRTSAQRQRVGSANGHSRLVTCCCIDAEQQLLITGSSDHTLCWWSLMLGSSSSPIRIVSLRDTATYMVPRGGAEGTSSSCSPLSLAERGGYPVDVSLFRRRLVVEYHNEALPEVARCEDADSNSLSPRRFQVGLFLLVLDTERVVRIFDALSGKLITYEIEPRTSATAVPSGTADSFSSVPKEVRLARYDCINGVDRVLLGGLCLVPWYLAHSAEYGATRGHTASIIFTAWCASLNCAVTADAHNVLLWRVHVGRQRTPAAEVLRAWRIAAGVRSVALCDAGATDEPSHLQKPSLFIAHASEPVIGQYDCLLRDFSSEYGTRSFPQPRLLRQLSLRVGIDVTGVSVDALAAVTVVTMRENAARRGNTERVVTAYALAACHATCGKDYEEAHAATADGRLYVYPLQLPRVTKEPENNHAPAVVDSATEPISPAREVHLSDSRTNSNNSIVSVLGLPCANLLVIGGRRVLYTAPLTNTATSAVPCDPLPLGWAAAQQLNRRGSNPPMRAPQPTAIFPGPLILLDDSTILGMADEESKAQANSNSVVEVEHVDSRLTGFLSRLVHIPHDSAASAPNSTEAAVCLVLSGSNDGLVQLWDVQYSRELWQCRAVPAREPITALAVHQYGARWLVAAGDQSGVVTLLDITSVLQVARQVVSADVQAPPKPAASTTGYSRYGLVRAEGRMLDRWLAHAEAVSGAFFTTVLTDAGDATVTAPQLVTTGEDSAVMLWELPSWVLPSASDVAPNNELSGIPLFRPGERGDAISRRRCNVPVRVQPSTTKLPKVTRKVYELWQRQYVQERLLGDELSELSVALTQFYTRTTCSDGITVSESKNVMPGEYETEEEAKLIDGAWAVLAADARAFSRFVDLVEPQGDTLAALRQPCNVVHAWCTSLSQEATAEPTTATLPNSPSTAKNRVCVDKDSDNMNYESAARPPAPSAAAGRAVPLPSPLILAFADRCCSGRAADGRSSARSRRVPGCEASASSVRKQLRRVLRVVVQSSVKDASSQGAPDALRGTQQTQNTYLEPSVLGAVADSSLSADGKLPPPLLPESAASASGAVIGNTDVMVNEIPTTSPATASVSTAPGGFSPGVTPNGLARQVARCGATPRRELGFTDESNECQLTPPSVPTAPFQNQSSGIIDPHRIGYGVDASPVGRVSAEWQVGVPAKHGHPLLSRAPRSTRHAGMNRSSIAPPLSHDHAVGADADLSTEANPSHKGLASVGVAATVIQQVNHDRRCKQSLQRLITFEQSDRSLCHRGTAGNRAAEKKGRLSVAAVSDAALRGGCVAFGLPQRSMLRESSATSQGEMSMAKQPKTRIDGSSQKHGSSHTAVLSPSKAAQVSISEAYLIPVLRRVCATSALLPEHSAASQNLTTSVTAASFGTTLTSESANSAWYAERKRRRDAAREKARLWNSQRVMKTLLGWTAPPVESCSDVPQPLRTMEGCLADGHIIPLDTKDNTVGHCSALSAAIRTTSPPVLDLPPILTLHGSTDSSPFPVVQGAMASSDATAAALTTLLRVSPTTAVDIAVRHGLPSRKTLRAEIAAAKVRMQESVRTRAAYQREHRAIIAEVDNDSVANVTEELGSGATDSLCEEQRDPDKVATAGGTSHRSHDSQMKSHHAIPEASSISPLGKSGCSPRRALQPPEGAQPRRMATVPLPIATTRQELFGNNTPRRK